MLIKPEPCQGRFFDSLITVHYLGCVTVEPQIMKRTSYVRERPLCDDYHLSFGEVMKKDGSFTALHFIIHILAKEMS